MKESAENYLETILILKEKHGEVRSIDIVGETGFTKASISVAVKKLRTAGYIQVDVNGHIHFTEQGKAKAEQILQRHTVLTKALESLGVPQDIASEDACKIEHYLSDITFEKIKEHIKKGSLPG